MTRSMFIAIYLLLYLHIINGQQTIALYDGKPPASENWTWEEAVDTANLFNTKIVYNVSEPSITAYLPPYYLATGTAVIIAPGGGMQTLSIDAEGNDLAKYLNSLGVAAFVLKYRLARSHTADPVGELMAKNGNQDRMNKENWAIVPLAMDDALAAVEYVRKHASEMDIDPNKIGIIGFSAGGTVAMSAAYHGKNESLINFVGSVYTYEPAIVLGELPTAKTPIFVLAASDDQLGLTLMSNEIYRTWHEGGHPAELHIYQRGGHGFGMREQNLPTDQWYKRFGEWLQVQGYLKRVYPSKYEKLYGEEAVAKGEIAAVERMKTDYASMARYRTANSQLPSPKKKEKRVVFIGDSITDAWPNVDANFFTENHFIGRGISAQTSAQLLLRFRQDVIDLKPKAVVIHIGTNDVAENTGPYSEEYTLSNIYSMVELAEAHSIKVIIASVLPATKFEWRRSLGDRSAMIVALNQRLRTYAASKKIPFVDYHSAMKNDKNGMDPAIAADGVHPTPEGYKIMEKLVLKTLSDCL